MSNGIRQLASSFNKIPLYLRNDIKPDLSAALTVAVLGIPQAMAFATIAGLPPVTGLYTSIISCIVASLLGSSSHLVTGPSNVTCMMIYSITTQLSDKYSSNPLEIALALSLLSGLLQLAFGLFRMGAVVKYISNSVVMGFTTGAGILIVFNQLRDFLGINLARNSDAHVIAALWETIRSIHLINPLGMLIAAGSLFLVIWTKIKHPKLPGPLLALLASSLVVLLLGLSRPGAGILRVMVVGDSSRMAGGLAFWHLPEYLVHPQWALLRELGYGAFSIAILGLIQSASIARSLAAQSGQRIDFNREFVAQGLANCVGSFFQCFPATGSFNRSAVCYQAGAKSRLAVIFSGLVTAAFLAWLGPLTNYIPRPAFAGLLMATAYYMIDRRRFMMIWRTSSHSRLVLGGTLGATLLLSLEYAVFVGIFLSVALLLHATGKPYLTQLVQRPDGGFEELPLKQKGRSKVVLVNMEGYFYFASVDDLDYELMQCLNPDTKVVVLRMKRLRTFGSSAMTMLDHFHELLQNRGIGLIACGIEDELRRVLTDSGIRAKLGEQNIFYADNRIFQSTELALARARSLVIEEQPSESEDQQEARLVFPKAAELMNQSFLRFGREHQFREALWLFSEYIKSHRAGPRPVLFLQDRNGKMADGLNLRELLLELTADPEFHSHPDCQAKQLAAYLKNRFPNPITDLVKTSLQSVPASASLPSMLAASVRNKGGPVPVLDEDGRMTGLIEQKKLLAALLSLHDQAAQEESRS